MDPLVETELSDGLLRIETLELINALGILKIHSSQEEKANIDAILKKTQISLPHSQLNLDINNIKESIETIAAKLEKGQNDLSESEIKFTFECRSLDMRTFMDEMSKLELSHEEYVTTIGARAMVTLSATWVNGSAEYRTQNLPLKYVPKTNKIIEKLTFSLSTQFLQSQNSETSRCLAFYGDSANKIHAWPLICANLKNLAIASGYTEMDIRSSLLYFVRHAGLDQTLYDDMLIDDIASALIKSVKPVDRLSVLWTSLKSLERPLNTPLQLVLSTAESYINKIFADPKKFKQRENQNIQALCAFIDGKISKEIKKSIKKRREHNLEISYKYYKELCLKLELDNSLMPKTVLKYNSRLFSETPLELFNIKASDESFMNIQTNLTSTSHENEEEEILAINNILRSEEHLVPQILSMPGSTTFPITPPNLVTPPSLGSIWCDSEDDDLIIFLKLDSRKYYTCQYAQCPLKFKINLLRSLFRGSLTSELLLCWSENSMYMEECSKSDYDEMKLTGIKISADFYNLEMTNLKTQNNLQSLLTKATGRSVSPGTRNSSQINYNFQDSNFRRDNRDSSFNEINPNSYSSNSTPNYRDNKNYSYRDRSASYDRSHTESKPFNQHETSPGYTNNRSFSRDGRNRSFDQNRNYGNNAQYHSNNNRDFNYNPYSKNQSGNQDARKYNPDNRSRERSFDTHLAYPDMKLGWNCSLNYNPLKNKICTKCNIPGSNLHHEFSCNRFFGFNSDVCKKCRRGMHYEKDCRPTNYSTSHDSFETSQVNTSSGEDDRLDKIIQLLNKK